MSDYNFPKELLQEIRQRWEASRGIEVDLPDDSTVNRLLDVCYHASLQTNEQRITHFVMAFISRSSIASGILCFDEAVELTDSELVRLSPVTQHRQTVIGCDQEAGSLKIWGLFEHGHSWVQQSSGDPPGVLLQPSDHPPDCLTIKVDGPGKLSISCGRVPVVHLRNGQFLCPKVNHFHSSQNPLGEVFRKLIGEMNASSRASHYLHTEPASAENQTLMSLYSTSILAILERIRLRKHGGSLLITNALHEHQFAHVTYTVSEHEEIFEDLVTYDHWHELLKNMDAISPGSESLERYRMELSLFQSSQKLIRSMNQISLLAAVDGAVILDYKLRLHGFGARFPLLLAPTSRITNAETGRNYYCDQWGLRHQSIFSVCHKYEQSVGLIVSQDGDVKAVKSIDHELYFWDGLLN